MVGGARRCTLQHLWLVGTEPVSSNQREERQGQLVSKSEVRNSEGSWRRCQFTRYHRDFPFSTQAEILGDGSCPDSLSREKII